MQTRKNTAWKYQGKEASASSAEEYTSFYNDKISITQKLVYNTYRMKASHQLQNLRSSWFQDFRVDKYYEKPGNHFPQALTNVIWLQFASYTNQGDLCCESVNGCLQKSMKSYTAKDFTDKFWAT